MPRKHCKRLAYDFSADHDAIAVDDILHIHKYLLKKSDMIFKSKNI